MVFMWISPNFKVVHCNAEVQIICRENGHMPCWSNFWIKL